MDLTLSYWLISCRVSMFLSTVNCDENSATGQKKTHCEDLLMHLENLYNQVNVKIITSYVRKKNVQSWLGFVSVISIHGEPTETIVTSLFGYVSCHTCFCWIDLPGKNLLNRDSDLS